MLTVIAIVLIGCFVGSYIVFKTGSYTLPIGSSLTLNIKNCTVRIRDPLNDNINDMRLSYRLQNLGSVSFIEQLPGKFFLNLVNVYLFDYCSLDLFIQPETTLLSLEIQCTKCYIIQDSTSLSISETFLMNGSNVYANFRNVSAGIINYSSERGYLSLNNFKVSQGSQNPITMIADGDIILQSTDGFLINYASGTGTFCFAGAAASNKTHRCEGD